jgi:hypothetical protein
MVGATDMAEANCAPHGAVPSESGRGRLHSAMGVQIEVVQARDTAAIDAAFAALVRNKTDALVVGAVLSSSPVGSNWPCWRRAMRFPRSIQCAT